MSVMGPIQRGLPVLSALPKGWPAYAIDILDCFFSIPLHPGDKERFAFTIPSVNHEEPDKRYQWRVLPQGMANSPTMCQLFVDAALEPVRRSFPKMRIIHYMDDILITGPEKTMLDQALIALEAALKEKGLLIAPEKVQKTDTVEFLGTKLNKQQVKPQKLKLSLHRLKTLNDFQKLLGDINWLRGYLPLSRQELAPLFAILEGNPDLNSPRELTTDGRKAIEAVEKAIQQAQVSRYDPSQPLLFCVLHTQGTPTGVFWQDAPIWWVHSHTQGQKVITYYPEAVAAIAMLGIKFSISAFGCFPDRLITPYTKDQMEILAGTVDNWAVLVTAYPHVIDNHYPKDKLLQFLCHNVVYFPIITSPVPLPDALHIFTDGSKTGLGVYQVLGRDPVQFQFRPGTPQVTECLTVLEVFKAFQDEKFNLLSDSNYVVNAVRQLEAISDIKDRSTVAPIFEQIRQYILARDCQFYIGHIRAHSGLPGPLAAANANVDQLTRSQLAAILLDPISQAQLFHKRFHVPAKTLRLRFHITREQARNVVKSCQTCVTFHHPPHVGVNPRGLKPLMLWQMDVTHVPEFGKQKWVHVSIDTCSGIIHASALSGEKVKNVKTHCLEAWAAWGKPHALKTDNGPAYIAKGFKSFCANMDVAHTTGLSYNPQGQGIVERANRTLKELLQKQKGGIEGLATPKDRLSTALFTLNFLILDEKGRSAADRHSLDVMRSTEQVKWKDVIDNKWYGPDPVIQRSRGAVCVFPQERPDPVWVPSRLTRAVLSKRDQDGPKEDTQSPERDQPAEDCDNSACPPFPLPDC